MYTDTVLTTGEALPSKSPDLDVTGVAGIAVALTIVVVVVVAIAVVTVVAIVLRKKKILYFVKPRSTLGRNGIITESTVGNGQYYGMVCY